jgi:Amt family ammonium transporter
VAITPAAGFVTPMSALLIGSIAGVFCYGMVARVKAWFGYDDSLDAFGVHGAGGTIGAVLTGVFAARAVNPILLDASGTALPLGLIDGSAHQLVNQLIGAAIASAMAAIGTLLILRVVDALIGLRVSPEHEAAGLDLTQHGEHGYHWEPVLDTGFQPPHWTGAAPAPVLDISTSVQMRASEGD